MNTCILGTDTNAESSVYVEVWADLIFFQFDNSVL